MIKIINGIVIKGKQLGRTIGFPTANVICKDYKIEDASFKINIILKGILYKGAGVYRKNINLFEAHIFNFNKEIYGENIEIIILEKIRKNIKISSLEEVKKLIENDIKKIKTIKNNIVTFGSFDKVHKGHESFLNQAKKYGDNLITIVATDKNIEKIKGNKPTNNLNKRIQDIKNLNISNKVISGNEDNHLKFLSISDPKVICLGYDQKGFLNELKKHITKNNLNIEIVRLKAYKENIYKSSLIK